MITNPTTTPNQTQILGDYGGAGEDDSISIDLMPANFGLDGYGEGDLLLFDNGLNTNNTDGLTAFKTDGTHQVLWSKYDSSNPYWRGAANPVEGKYYFIKGGVMTTVEIDGTVYRAIMRMGGNKVLETVAMDLAASEFSTTLDDAVAVNPIDGSVWFVRELEGGERSVVRVDTAAAAAEGGDVFLAPVSVEITWSDESFDCGINSMCFSPDGKYLAIGSLTTTDTVNGTVNDRLAIFTVVPEPSSCLLISLGMVFLAMIRRRS